MRIIIKESASIANYYWMQQKRTITIELDVWESTQLELEKLRLQNKLLKAELQELKNQSPQFDLRHSLTQSSFIKTREQSSLVEKDKKQEFKKEMEDWLKKLSHKNLKFSNNNEQEIKQTLSQIQQEKDQPTSSREIPDQHSHVPITIENKVVDIEQKSINLPEEIFKLSKRQSSLQEKIKEIKQMKLIQAICLYGPSQTQIRSNIASRKMYLKNTLLYCNKKQQSNSFKIYSEYFYPEGLVTVRNIRQEQAPTQIHQIIFRKNAKKEDCSIFLFRGDENNEQLKAQNPILTKINPGKWLCAFFVQFTDFQVLDVDDFISVFDGQNSKSFYDSKEYTDKINGEKEEKQKNGQQSDRVRLSKLSTHHVKGKYTLCVFTYFPIITFMQILLSSVLDEIKIRRVQKFGTSNIMKDVTIKFFISELQKICPQIQSQIEKIPPNYGKEQKIQFGNFHILFNLNESKIDDLLFSGWAFDIIKIFDKQILYDLFTHMMTEHSICFVSENMHLLTYVVFFFVCILTIPFSYPHPCISNVFNFELLESPFVVTVGINQSSGWLEENIGKYHQNKIFVDLNEEPKIKGKKKLKTVKSQKLKRIFNSVYRKIQNLNPVPQIFRKKQTIIRPPSKEQNQFALGFIKSLQNFYTEQIFNFLPNPNIISTIRERIDEKNETSKVYTILKEIVKYLKESRKPKQKEKDSFVDSLVQMQIFYVYIGIIYELD